MKLAIIIILLGGFFNLFKEHEEETELEYETPVRRKRLKELPARKKMLALPPRKPLELPPHEDL